MSEMGESLFKGMEEALAFAKGENTDAVVSTPEEENGTPKKNAPFVEHLLSMPKSEEPVECPRSIEEGRKAEL